MKVEMILTVRSPFPFKIILERLTVFSTLRD